MKRFHLLLLLPLTAWAQDGPITSLTEELTVTDSHWLVVDDGVTTQKATRANVTLTDAEVETAYDAQVGVVSQAAAEAGTSTTAERWTPERVRQAIAALESGASQLSDLSDVNTTTPTNRNVLVADGVDFESRALVEADISDLGAYITGISGLAPDTATTAAAQPNITSLGTLTSLGVDNVNINGNTISTTAGTDLNITPLAGQQIVLDGTIVVDAGVVTGATSITSSAFVGSLTGQADTVASISGLAPDTATTAAAQPNITSLGTLTTLTVDNITLNGSGISHATAADLTITATAGQAVAIESVSIDGGVITGATIDATNTVTINASDITDLSGSTDITADLEEEGQINATAVTGNAVDDQVIVGSGANTAAWATLPDCDDEANTLAYDQATNSFSCNADAGAGGGMTSFSLDGDTGTPETVTDGQTVTIAGGDGIATSVGATDTVTVVTASEEAGFLNDGAAVSLTCGASNQGKAQAMDDGSLEYCDGATTSVLQSIPGSLDADLSTFSVAASSSVSGSNTGDQTTITGNAGTATALAANGANCSAGNYPLGVDASGAVETCTADDDSPDSDAEVPDNITVSAGSVDNSTITLSTSSSTVTGRISYDATNDRIQVGDGVATDDFYSGAHTTNTNADTICTGTGNYLDGEGNCDALDPAGTDNSTDVTLAGTPDYITIAGQVITRGTVDIGDDTNLAAGRSLTLTGDSVAADAELYTRQETFIIETATTSDDLRVKADGAITLTGLDCVATGATTPSAQVMTVMECTSAAASCASSGYTVTLAATATNYNDATGTDSAIDDNDWWGLDTTSLTTAADLTHCTVTYTVDD